MFVGYRLTLLELHFLCKWWTSFQGLKWGWSFQGIPPPQMPFHHEKDELSRFLRDLNLEKFNLPDPGRFKSPWPLLPMLSLSISKICGSPLEIYETTFAFFSGSPCQLLFGDFWTIESITVWTYTFFHWTLEITHFLYRNIPNPGEKERPLEWFFVTSFPAPLWKNLHK